jgi:hypothetical protein
MLNLVHPNALYVLGALTQARLAGLIEPPPPAAADLFGSRLRRMADMLRRFGDGLGRRPDEADDLSFSLVLIEPMLWTRYTVGSGTVSTSVHADASGKGDVVVVTTEAAMDQMVERRMTFGGAEQLGLVRIYGDHEQSRRLRALAAGVGL